MGDYIGYTRSKKLKKLYFISRALLVNHGIRYFWHVIKLELRKNGLGVFSVDEKPISAFDDISFHDQYQNYLKNLTDKLEKESSTKLNESFNMPKILMILIIDDQNFDDIRNTIDSIKILNLTQISI